MPRLIGIAPKCAKYCGISRVDKSERTNLAEMSRPTHQTKALLEARSGHPSARCGTRHHYRNGVAELLSLAPVTDSAKEVS